MSLGNNLQLLRRMRSMTQEELAERLNVSRQTVSKWELDGACPELEKLVELCSMFNCSMDSLVREDLNAGSEAYSGLRFEQVEGFRYVQYAVISAEPEEDAIDHVRRWAQQLGINEPVILGWDFPVLSQEQINVYNMHGYAAALVLQEGTPLPSGGQERRQGAQRYAAITIKEPIAAPFSLIPNAYKTLLSFMQANGTQEPRGKGVIGCFEREYEIDGVGYMDVYIAAD